MIPALPLLIDVGTSHKLKKSSQSCISCTATNSSCTKHAVPNPWHGTSRLTAVDAKGGSIPNKTTVVVAVVQN